MTSIRRARAADQTDITTMVPRARLNPAVLLPRPTGAGMADERGSSPSPHGDPTTAPGSRHRADPACASCDGRPRGG
jgi:hypothetical protein